MADLLKNSKEALTDVLRETLGDINKVSLKQGSNLSNVIDRLVDQEGLVVTQKNIETLKTDILVNKNNLTNTFILNAILENSQVWVKEEGIEEKAYSWNKEWIDHFNHELLGENMAIKVTPQVQSSAAKPVDPNTPVVTKKNDKEIAAAIKENVEEAKGKENTMTDPAEQKPAETKEKPAEYIVGKEAILANVETLLQNVKDEDLKVTVDILVESKLAYVMGDEDNFALKPATVKSLVDSSVKEAEARIKLDENIKKAVEASAKEAAVKDAAAKQKELTLSAAKDVGKLAREATIKNESDGKDSFAPLTKEVKTEISNKVGSKATDEVSKEELEAAFTKGLEARTLSTGAKLGFGAAGATAIGLGAMLAAKKSTNVNKDDIEQTAAEKPGLFTRIAKALATAALVVGGALLVKSAVQGKGFADMVKDDKKAILGKWTELTSKKPAAEQAAAPSL